MEHFFNMFALQSSKFNSEVPKRNCTLEELVNDEVTQEIDSCDDATTSKRLLMQFKDPLIEYLKSEYLKAPNGQFVSHVCELTNLDEDLSHAFAKIFMALEKIAIRIEKNRSFVRTPEELRRDNELFEKLMKKKQEVKREDSPEPPLRVTSRDPRPVRCQYSPPKSMFPVKDSVELVERKDSLSHNEVLVDSFNETSSSKDVHKNDGNHEETSFIATSPPLSPEDDTDEEDTYSTRRARSPSYYRKRVAENNAFFNAIATTERSNKSTVNKYSMPPRSSFPPPTSNQRRPSSVFNSINAHESNEDEKQQQRQPANKKAKRVGFDNCMVENEGRTKEVYNEPSGTICVPLVEHHAVDTKYVIPAVAVSYNTLALPNQPLVVKAPEKSCYETWQKFSYNHSNKHFEDKILDVLHQFRHNSFVPKFKGDKRKLHLVIKDSLLFPTDFEDKYKQCLQIDAKYPQRMETITDVFEDEIYEKRNDYYIKNVIFSMGLDLICYELDAATAIKNLLSFLEKFIIVLQEAFDPNGPKRYEKYSKRENISVLAVEIPKLIIITVPYIDSHATASTNKHKIIEMNNALRNFVKKNQAKHFKNHNQIIEIYDWEKEAQNYRQCTPADFESRFKVLTTALSEKYQMFIVGPEQQNNYEGNDYHEG